MIHRIRTLTRGTFIPLVAAGAMLGALQLTGISQAGASPAPAATKSTSSAAQAPAAVNGKISRATVVKRMKAWIGHKGIVYSETKLYKGYGGKGKYRGDCSGFVSMSLNLSDKNGGYSTVTITPKLTAIAASKLKEGDLIGHVGPSSGGQNGHIQIFVKWANSKHTKVEVAEQGGLANVPDYPHYHTYAWPEHMSSGTALKAYRYKNITG